MYFFPIFHIAPQYSIVEQQGSLPFYFEGTHCPDGAFQRENPLNSRPPPENRGLSQHSERPRGERPTGNSRPGDASSEELEKRKRRYRGRRKDLEKHIKCGFSGCLARFSSQMAFRNHNRIKHNVKLRFSEGRP